MITNTYLNCDNRIEFVFKLTGYTSGARYFCGTLNREVVYLSNNAIVRELCENALPYGAIVVMTFSDLKMNIDSTILNGRYLLIIYYEIVHEYKIKKMKLSSTQKNQSCNQCPGG